MKKLMKKISVFALLLSLMLSFVVPVPVAAATETANTYDDVKYKDIEEFMHGIGYTSFVKEEGYSYIFITGPQSKHYYLYKIKGDKNSVYVGSRSEDGVIFVLPEDGVEMTRTHYISYDYSMPQYNDWEPQKTDTYIKVSGYVDSRPDNPQDIYFTHNGVVTVRYSDLDIYICTYSDDTKLLIRGYDTLLYESNLEEGYNFQKWCADAGLNCQSSSNESSGVIPYSFNSYWHIVRKTSKGNWLLTTIGNSVLQENIDSYKLYIGDNGNFHVASIYGGDNVNGYKLNVRQYEYDTDGWKLSSYETFDTRETSGIVNLGYGSGFDDTRKFAFTNVDIFVGTEFEPTYPKSTEYFDVTSTPDTPDEPDSPTSTPSNPSGGSGSEGGGTGGGTRPESPDIGGDFEPGGGLDFIISLFTKIWTDICSVNMSVDGYSINLQQIVIYGALVSIVGGFIMHFIFGRK